MRILQISYSLDGGAGRACVRLHKALLNEGIDSLLAFAQGKEYSVKQTVKVGRFDVMRRLWWDRLPTRFYRTRNIFSSWSNNYLPVRFVQNLTALSPDIVHVHWIGDGLLPAYQFPEFGVPIVWTLHDMQPFTGGCHYSAGCERFTDGCGSCSQLGSTSRFDLSRLNAWSKARVMSRLGKKVALVAPSNWLRGMAQKSRMGEHLATQVETIAYGIDLSEFSAADRWKARKRFGVKGDDLVIVAGAAGGVADKRKGLDQLPGFMDNVVDELIPANAALLTFGGEGVPWKSNPKWRAIHLSSVFDDQMLVDVYACADLVVVPSSEDNLPLVALEAIACGRPVVAANVGGIPDLVKDGITGILAEKPESSSLAAAAITVLRSQSMAGWNKSCRDFAETNFDSKKQALKYVALYKRLLKENG